MPKMQHPQNLTYGLDSQEKRAFLAGTMRAFLRPCPVVVSTQPQSSPAANPAAAQPTGPTWHLSQPSWLVNSPAAAQPQQPSLTLPVGCVGVALGAGLGGGLQPPSNLHQPPAALRLQLALSCPYIRHTVPAYFLEAEPMWCNTFAPIGLPQHVQQVQHVSLLPLQHVPQHILAAAGVTPIEVDTGGFTPWGQPINEVDYYTPAELKMRLYGANSIDCFVWCVLFAPLANHN